MLQNLIGEEYPKDETAMNSSVTCAKRVKELLLECGCSTALLNDLDESIPSDDLDSDDVRDKSNQLRSVKIGCYILRRVFATMMRSTMGLSMYVTYRMLGHAPISAGGKKTSKLQSVDLNSPDTQRDIAAKMERYVFDPEVTLNPAFYPYKASGTNLQLIEYSEYKIVNNTDSAVMLDLNLEAAETGERITIAMSHDATPQLYNNSRPKDWTDHHRTVIGDTTEYGEEKE